jgi:hypothetical protein
VHLLLQFIIFFDKFDPELSDLLLVLLLPTQYFPLKLRNPLFQFKVFLILQQDHVAHLVQLNVTFPSE